MDNTTNATGSHGPGAGGAWANTGGARANAEGEKYECTYCGAFLSAQEAIPVYKAAKRTFSKMNGTSRNLHAFAGIFVAAKVHRYLHRISTSDQVNDIMPI